jgi:hypothetical protein
MTAIPTTVTLWACPVCGEVSFYEQLKGIHLKGRAVTCEGRYQETVYTLAPVPDTAPAPEPEYPMPVAAALKQARTLARRMETCAEDIRRTALAFTEGGSGSGTAVAAQIVARATNFNSGILADLVHMGAGVDAWNADT